jgi:outer membrane protein assembly factor BamB
MPQLLDGGDGGAEMRALSGGAVRIPLPSGLTGEPERKWSVDVDLSESRSMIVGEDRFFAVESERDDDFELVARSLSDGREVWAEALPGPAILVDDAEGLLVQMTGDEPGSDREWRSYDPGRGDLRWKTEVDVNLYELSRHGDRYVASDRGRITAFRVDDGEEVWSESTNGIPFAVEDSRVYLADGDEVRAVSLSDGKEIWSADAPGEVSSLVVAGDRVVVEADGDIVGLAAGSGKEAWESDVHLGEGVGLNAVDGSTVVIVGEDDAAVIDPRTGEEKDEDAFHVDQDDWTGFAYGLPSGDILVLGYEALDLIVIDGTSGERIGRLDVSIKSMSSSMLYGVDDEDELSAYRLDDLEMAWTIDVDGMTSVTAGDGLILVETADGYELWS